MVYDSSICIPKSGICEGLFSETVFVSPLRLVSPQNPQCDVRALAQCQLCLVCHCVRQRQEEPEKRILFLGQSELRPASLEINLNQQVRTNDHQIWLN